MRIRIKEKGFFGAKRIDARCEIDNIIIKEDMLKPEQESISIFLAGKHSSGIISLTARELADLAIVAKNDLGLIKKSKKISR